MSGEDPCEDTHRREALQVWHVWRQLCVQQQHVAALRLRTRQVHQVTPVPQVPSDLRCQGQAESAHEERSWRQRQRNEWWGCHFLPVWNDEADSTVDVHWNSWDKPAGADLGMIGIIPLLASTKWWGRQYSWCTLKFLWQTSWCRFRGDGIGSNSNPLLLQYNSTRSTLCYFNTASLGFGCICLGAMLAFGYCVCVWVQTELIINKN